MVNPTEVDGKPKGISSQQQQYLPKLEVPFVLQTLAAAALMAKWILQKDVIANFFNGGALNVGKQKLTCREGGAHCDEWLGGLAAAGSQVHVPHTHGHLLWLQLVSRHCPP